MIQGFFVRLCKPALHIGASLFFAAFFGFDLWYLGRFVSWAPLRVAADLLLFGLVIGWVVRRAVQGRGLGPGPLDAPLTAVLAVAGVSALQARDPALAIEPLLFLTAVTLWFKLLEQETSPSPRARDWVLGLLLGGSALVVLQMVLTFASWYAGFPPRSPHQVSWLEIGAGLVPPALPEGSQPTAARIGIGYVAMLAAPAVAWLVATPSGRLRLFLGASLFLTGIALVLVQSRSAWVAAAAGCATLAVLLAQRPGLIRWRFFAAAAVAAVLGSILFMTLSSRASSTLSRLFIWGDALRIWWDAPLLGVGPGNYPLAQLVGRPGSPLDDVFVHAHDLPVQWLAVVGLGGMAAALWLLGTLGVRLLAAWRSAGPGSRPRLAGCIGGLVAFLGWNVTEVQTHSFLLWGAAAALTAVTLGMPQERRPHRGEVGRTLAVRTWGRGRSPSVTDGPAVARAPAGMKPRSWPPRARALHITLAVGMVLAVVLVEREHLSLHRAGLLSQQGHWEEAGAALREAAQLSPSTGFYQWQLGLVMAQQGRWAEADRLYGGADQVRAWPPALASWAYVAARTGNLERAIALGLRAEQLRPQEGRYSLFLAQLYEQAGRGAEAAGAYGRALALHPEWLGSAYWGSRRGLMSREEALEAALAWTDSNPQLVAPQRARYKATLLLAGGRPEEATVIMEHTLAEGFPGVAEEVSVLLAGDAQNIYVRERALFSRGEGPGATYSLLGMAALSRGDQAAAASAFAAAIRHAPAYYPARLGASALARRQGDHDTAIREAMLAVVFGGGRAASAALGGALLDAGRPTQAVPHLEAGSEEIRFYSGWYGLLFYQRRELLPNLLPEIPDLAPDRELATALRDLAAAYRAVGDDQGYTRALTRLRNSQRDPQH